MPARNFQVWADRTPPGFVFDVKPYKQLTFHDRDNPPNDEVHDAFNASVQPLRDAGKLGALHFQFAPWFMQNKDNLQYMLSLRERYPDDRISIEFRQRSWYDEEPFSDLLEAFQRASLALTVVDEPQIGSGTVPTLLEVTNPELVIVRFHGRNASTWYKRTQTTGERFNYLYARTSCASGCPGWPSWPRAQARSTCYSTTMLRITPYRMGDSCACCCARTSRLPRWWLRRRRNLVGCLAR
jgi:uncharacterized protein YecE (DUF72 family)